MMRFMCGFKLNRCFSRILDLQLYRSNSTIYALASGHAKCGVAVIRISGPNASSSLFRLAGMKKFPTPRHAYLRKLKDPVTNETLDHGLVIWFPGPRSFTGEDTCEMHIHGGIAVISSMLDALGKIDDYRPAEAGEFTKRSFFAGKLDLLEVEGLGDLIEAETDVQRKQALLQMEGTLSKLYLHWRESLIKCAARVEAYIDFSEEENIESGILEQNERELTELLTKIKCHLSDGRRGERLRDGVRVVILGEPNVGKSSLLNLLCQKQAAIVSPIPGTTRDIVERPMNIQGFPVLLSDTAGLRTQTQDPVELEGVKRARECVAEADLHLLVADAVEFNKAISLKQLTFMECLQQYIERLLLSDLLIRKINQENNSLLVQDNSFDSKKFTSSNPGMTLKDNCLLILNKKDLIRNASDIEGIMKELSNVCIISCETSEGLEEFMDKLHHQLSGLCANPCRENPTITQSRHRHHLQQCVNSLESYMNLYEESNKSEDCDVVLMVHHLRQAMRSLGKITGHISTEEVLDVIFSSFCIGK